MMLPGKLIISTPMLAALALLCFFLLANVVFAEGVTPPAPDDFTYWAGRVAIIVAIVAIAVAAVYNAFRKASIAEWKELAEARKGKLMEKELEVQEKNRRIRDLERENEDLEKKNFRLQERGSV
jgi:hypothetical protein